MMLAMATSEPRKLYERTYDGEDIIDAVRHLIEAVEDLPVDEHGFFKGTLRITVTYEENP